MSHSRSPVARQSSWFTSEDFDENEVAPQSYEEEPDIVDNVTLPKKSTFGAVTAEARAQMQNISLSKNELRDARKELKKQVKDAFRDLGFSFFSKSFGKKSRQRSRAVQPFSSEEVAGSLTESVYQPKLKTPEKTSKRSYTGSARAIAGQVS